MFSITKDVPSAIHRFVSSKLLMTLSILCQHETLFRNKVIKDIIRYDEIIVEKSSFLINVTSAFSRRQLCEYTETVKKIT